MIILFRRFLSLNVLMFYFELIIATILQWHHMKVTQIDTQNSAVFKEIGLSLVSQPALFIVQLRTLN